MIAFSQYKIALVLITRKKELYFLLNRPRKKKKTDAKIEFTEGHKKHNWEVSSKRIDVEHAIGGIKRY